MDYRTIIDYNNRGGVEVLPSHELGLRDRFLEWLDHVPDQWRVQTANSGYGIQETNITLEICEGCECLV